jgi:hypothetical protein
VGGRAQWNEVGKWEKGNEGYEFAEEGKDFSDEGKEGKDEVREEELEDWGIKAKDLGFGQSG